MIIWPESIVSAYFERESRLTYLHCEIVLNLVQCASCCEARDCIRRELFLSTRHDAIAVSQLARREHKPKIGEIACFRHSHTNCLVVFRKNLCLARRLITLMIVDDFLLYADSNRLNGNSLRFAHPISIW